MFATFRLSFCLRLSLSLRFRLFGFSPYLYVTLICTKTNGTHAQAHTTRSLARRRHYEGHVLQFFSDPYNAFKPSNQR